jgi:hypothetical protein
MTLRACPPGSELFWANHDQIPPNCSLKKCRHARLWATSLRKKLRRGGSSETRVIRLRKLKETARLPAVYWLAGSCSGCELDGLCFFGCGSDVAGGVGEASEFGAVVVVVVEVEFLAWQHRL